MTNHRISFSTYPAEGALYLDAPWMVDGFPERPAKDENESDHIRIYVPVDLSAEAILRRLDRIVWKYGAASEANEWFYSSEVSILQYQIEVYDMVWKERDNISSGHSPQAISLVKRFVGRLEEIPDACAECFPFELIEELSEEYLTV
ncbi:MAG: hypothetical protein IJ130_14395 [Solobacterium sp.]|nr:hypothetical protein [Solobacterium sp.]